MRPDQPQRLVIASHWVTFIWALTFWIWLEFRPWNLIADIPLAIAPYLLVVLAVWIKQGRWIWFPWQHSGSSK